MKQIYEVIDEISEEPDKPYVIGSREYAYEVLPYVEAVYQETKLYDFNNVQYICATKFASRTVEKMLKNTVESNKIQIARLYEQNANAEQQLYGKMVTKTEMELDRLDSYYYPGATLYGMVGDALKDVETDDMARFFSMKIPGGKDLIRNYIEEQIINYEICKAKENDNVNRPSLTSDLLQECDEMER